MEDNQIINTNEEEKGITLNDILFIIKKNILIIILITAILTVGGAVYGFFFKPYKVTATATAVVMVDTSNGSTNQSDYQNLVQATYMINTYSEMIKSNMVAKMVQASETGQKYDLTIKGIIENTTVKSSTNSLIVTISYKCSAEKATEVDKAIEICNAILDKTIELVNSKDGEEYVYDKLANCLKKVDEASVDTAIASRGAAKVILICFAIGLVLSFGIAFIRHLLDDTYTSKEDFEKTFKINVLTLLPDLVDLENTKKKGAK